MKRTFSSLAAATFSKCTLADTVLAPLAQFAVETVDGAPVRISCGNELPFNWCSLILVPRSTGRRVPLCIRQGSLAEMAHSTHATAATLVVDLAGQRPSPIAGVNTLRNLSWNSSVTLARKLDLTRLTNVRGRTAEFLQPTFAALAEILNDATARTSDAAPSVTIDICCEQGLERSLVLFNLVVVALAALQFAAPLCAVVEHLEAAFVTRSHRYTLGGQLTQIDNMDIPLTIRALPRIVRTCLRARRSVTALYSSQQQ
jgi:hypothetical protein